MSLTAGRSALERRAQRLAGRVSLCAGRGAPSRRVDVRREGDLFFGKCPSEWQAPVEHCADTEDTLCFDCAEAFATALDACGRTRRTRSGVVDGTPLLCADNALPGASKCDILTGAGKFVSLNHALKCANGETPEGTACVPCDDAHCAECRDKATCDVCAGSTNTDGYARCPTTHSSQQTGRRRVPRWVPSCDRCVCRMHGGVWRVVHAMRCGMMSCERGGRCL